MPTVRYSKQCYLVQETQSVLDTLLEHGIDFPYSCKIGTCQSCLTRLVEGEISVEAQEGLKPTLVAKNYFLACQCQPKTDIVIALPEQDETAVSATIIDISKLSHNVLQLRLATDALDVFRAGQYINLVVSDKLVRSYSIANVPKAYIELQIKLMPDGMMSTWLMQQAQIGTSLHIRGPMGDCFYHNPNHDAFPIVLAGTGTGLAPLVGIANDALEQGHNGDITLIHGGVVEDDLYLHNELCVLQKTYANFNYVPCVLQGSGLIQQASIEQVLLQSLKGIEADVRLFICGPEEITKKMKMKAFLAGVPSAFIYSDSFITAGS